MSDRMETPPHVKFRREGEGGLVYDHENYGYEDATLSTVSDTVVDVLERAADGCSRRTLEAEFTPATVEALVAAGFIRHER
jgi:putative mycofactocin binding protein MftB